MPLIVDGREVELFNRVKKLNLKVVDRDLNSITKVVSKPLTFGAVEVVKREYELLSKDYLSRRQISNI